MNLVEAKIDKNPTDIIIFDIWPFDMTLKSDGQKVWTMEISNYYTYNYT